MKRTASDTTPLLDPDLIRWFQCRTAFQNAAWPHDLNNTPSSQTGRRQRARGSIVQPLHATCSCRILTVSTIDTCTQPADSLVTQALLQQTSQKPSTAQQPTGAAERTNNRERGHTRQLLTELPRAPAQEASLHCCLSTRSTSSCCGSRKTIHRWLLIIISTVVDLYAILCTIGHSSEGSTTQVVAVANMFEPQRCDLQCL